MTLFMRQTLIAALLTLTPLFAHADDVWPRTRAEQTDYAETSALSDVSAFLHALTAKGAPVAVREIGKTAGGRPIVAAVASRPAVTDAASARASGKLVVYVQANIHGGEVEGKEAAQMLLRDIATNRDGGAAWLDRMVLVVVPNYNADGNETLGDGPKIRPSQDGPARVGQRPNGAGLDLNRDAVKALAPETRTAIMQVYRAWDPDLTFDLHTTNGTRHGYLLTYSPPLNPATDADVLGYARDTLLPDVRARLKREHGWLLFDYGNVENRPGAKGWYTFGQEGRYVTNYVGLRNRLSVLSEAASFQPFKTRVEVTLAFVRAVLDQVARDADRVRALTRGADERVVAWGLDPSKAPPLGVRFGFEKTGVESVPLEVVAANVKVDHHKAPDPSTVKPTDLPVYDRFVATRTSPFPAAYTLPPGATKAVELLRLHGVKVSRLKAPWRGPAEVFRVAEKVTSRQGFQGGNLTRLEGAFARRNAEAPAGSFLVPTAQPLGRLAFHLLEPEGLDGLAAWGLLDGLIEAPGDFPVLKLMTTPEADAEALP